MEKQDDSFYSGLSWFEKIQLDNFTDIPNSPTSNFLKDKEKTADEDFWNQYISDIKYIE
mgnify:CR=1 FL=1